MPCAPCWPAGPSLCSSLPFIGAGLSPPQAGHLPTFLSPRTTPQKTAAAQGFVLTAFSLFFAALSPRYKLSKLFLPAAVKKYVAKATLRACVRARVKAKTAFRAKLNTGKRTHNTRCFWLPTAAFMLVPDLSTIFLLHWRHTLFTAGLHASCKFYGVRHVFGTTCRFLNMTAGSSPLSRLL